MSSLEEIIRQRIRRDGPLSFRDYMEMCLYHPYLGYYNSTIPRIGRQGDFYTSSNLTSAYGASLGVQLAEMWDIMGGEHFTIVEVGAGTGQLCRDILDYFKSIGRYEKLNYWIVEQSPFMRSIEQSTISEKVLWYDSVSALPEFRGCLLSNELLDNLPVHVVVQEDELKEISVDDQDGFIELKKPASDELYKYFQMLEVELPVGFRTEVNLDALKWQKEISQKLKKGFVVTIDYGGPSSKLYSPSRREGTLVCFYKHEVEYDPYLRPGEQDITAHVNFSALQKRGEELGLKTTGLTNQSSFLMALGFRQVLLDHTDNGEVSLEAALRVSRLANRLLIDMGEKFQVLIQHKEIPDPVLRGLA